MNIEPPVSTMAEAADPVLPGIRATQAEMVALRHHLHAHPELAFEEFATSDLVAERLASWGYEVHRGLGGTGVVGTLRVGAGPDRKSTRLNSSHSQISYAVFCLKKKKKKQITYRNNTTEL